MSREAFRFQTLAVVQPEMLGVLVFAVLQDAAADAPPALVADCVVVAMVQLAVPEVVACLMAQLAVLA